MAAPRVFISSTFYDLRDVRNDLERFVESLGYQAVAHERGDVPYEREKELEAYCYREIGNVDVLVCVLGGHFGSQSTADADRSISQMEFRTAHKLNKQIYTFVREEVLSEHKTFLANRDVEGFRSVHADDPRIHEFLTEVLALGRNNVVKSFSRTEHITDFLRSQWAGLFRNYLDERERAIEGAWVRKLETAVQTVEQLVTLLEKERRNESTGVADILRANHPLAQRLQDQLSTKYRPRFINFNDVEAWLADQNFRRDPEDFLRETYAFKSVASKDGYAQDVTLLLARSLFDEEGMLRVMREGDWKDELLQVEDEIPF